MNVYLIHPVLDNRFFEGLALLSGAEILATFPRDWRKQPSTWETKRLASTWHARDVEGNVRSFNDYPCINLSYPAFSQRAVDLLRETLETNGELLPVRHPLGQYYFFNCTRLTNAIDLSKSPKSPSGLTEINGAVFIQDEVTELDIFKDRALPSQQLCTQRFVERVQSAGLQGFIFVPVWPLPPGATHHSERYRLCKLAEKWKPK